MYGGLGDRYSFGTHDTSQYFGPTINWAAPHGMTLSFSPQFGLNDYSIPRLYRFGVSYEIEQFLGHFFIGDCDDEVSAVNCGAGGSGLTAIALGVADGAWLRNVPPRDHQKTNPYRGAVRRRSPQGEEFSSIIALNATVKTRKEQRSGLR